MVQNCVFDSIEIDCLETDMTNGHILTGIFCHFLGAGLMLLELKLLKILGPR